MKHKPTPILFLCTIILFFATTFPALANTSTDEIGAATTLYQAYLENKALGEIEIKTNVAGQSPQAENFINTALDLSTRLVPFSYDASMQYYANVKPTTFFVTFRGRNYNDQNKQVQQKVTEIASQAASLPSDYQKIKYINTYLVDHCQYLAAAVTSPEKYPKAFTAYGCLLEGKAVCEGYANSVQLLCEALNIPCIKVTGSAYGGDHIWNAVYLNNKWWMLDVTFNDPVGKQDAEDRWAYFLLDLNTFAQKGTHTYDDSAYQTSKKIYLGKTTGQKTAVPIKQLSLTDAILGDIADANYLQDVTENDNNATQPTIPTSSVNESTLQRANYLKSLGLFVGDESGFRLQDSMTRIEMGVMVMRMNDGLASLQKNGAYYASLCPFYDVPQWAKSSIGFLYDKHLVSGQSDTIFGTGVVSKRDYAVMMLRVLGIEHSYQDALAIAVTHGILTETQASNETAATRGDIVDMTYATLQLISEQQNNAV